MVVKRFDVWLIDLDPSKGSEIKKVRPCFVVSPDEINKYLSTVIIVPLTSTIKNYPTRINCVLKEKQDSLVLTRLEV